MAESHVVSGLISKREEITEQITTIDAEIERLQGGREANKTLKDF